VHGSKSSFEVMTTFLSMRLMPVYIDDVINESLYHNTCGTAADIHVTFL